MVVKRTPRRSRNAVTMHEVAKHVGVSPMTVSRVMSGDANVEETMRQRTASHQGAGIFAQRRGSQLGKGRHVHLGLLYNNPSAAYLNELLVGVLEQSSHAGCQIVLEKCGTRNERAAIERLLGDGIGGIILPPPLSDSKVMLGALRDAKIPFIAVATGRPEAEGISVRIDDFEAAAAMTRHLLSLGHRENRFHRRGAESDRRVFSARPASKKALAEAGLPVRSEWVKQGSFSYRSGLTAAEQILSSASTSDRDIRQ
jgi:LacI family transcriptional regulator